MILAIKARIRVFRTLQDSLPHLTMRLLLRLILGLMLVGAATGLAAGAAIWFYLVPQLPAVETLRDVQFQVPLKVYSRDGLLMAEFGEKRRIPVRLPEVPKGLIAAVLAAEDDRFYEHPGVDWQGLARAAWSLATTGEKTQGGSTITMQVARNFFLEREKTYIRKLNEILLAVKIESSLDKDQILELYFNKIFLGHRAYGVGSAAQVYYGRPLAELTTAEMAMIAGLPKAPSAFNPISNPQRALSRRSYVLRRMREVGYIDEAEFELADAQPITAQLHGFAVEIDAPYVAEMVRAYMVERYGEDAYVSGYSVTTTVDSRLQGAATTALRRGLVDYTERHGYRGPEARLETDGEPSAAQARATLEDIPRVGGLVPAVVFRVGEQEAEAYLTNGETIDIPWSGLSWARPYISEDRRGPSPKGAADVVAPGDIVRVREDEEGAWRLTQVPRVEGALVALDPGDGAVRALQGGFDFYLNKFNRAVQAKRQPGSNFKPFIYSAALGSGLTPASLINDAPVVFEDTSLEASWRPENYSGKFFGPTRLREALTKSRNLVSIRVLERVGIPYTVRFLERFGFAPDELPRNLSLALGALDLEPIKVARGFAVFANGGHRVTPYFVDRITDYRGEVVFEAAPPVACAECWQAIEKADAQEADPEMLAGLAPRAIPPENAWLLRSMLKDVIRRGTGRKALALGRDDIAGKTGTTNQQRDAWFSGFNGAMVATAWVGFDKLAPLGARETGGRAALPVWIDFMAEALEDMPSRDMAPPPGLVTVRIDPTTGLLATSDFPGAIFETFRKAHVPTKQVDWEGPATAGGESSGSITEQLF
ncbi:MAG: penicillin-binding protein 1A [Gammaproteobacteria bacterium]|nr:penicillin-binding protein 1A [Gammaproteobacteria bacterium]